MPSLNPYEQLAFDRFKYKELKNAYENIIKKAVDDKYNPKPKKETPQAADVKAAIDAVSRSKKNKKAEKTEENKIPAHRQMLLDEVDEVIKVLDRTKHISTLQDVRGPMLYGLICDLEERVENSEYKGVLNWFKTKGVFLTAVKQFRAQFEVGMNEQTLKATLKFAQDHYARYFREENMRAGKTALAKVLADSKFKAFSKEYKSKENEIVWADNHKAIEMQRINNVKEIKETMAKLSNQAILHPLPAKVAKDLEMKAKRPLFKKGTFERTLDPDKKVLNHRFNDFEPKPPSLLASAKAMFFGSSKPAETHKPMVNVKKPKPPGF